MSSLTYTFKVKILARRDPLHPGPPNLFWDSARPLTLSGVSSTTPKNPNYI